MGQEMCVGEQIKDAYVGLPRDKGKYTGDVN